jgi:hypothetical protein
VPEPIAKLKPLCISPSQAARNLIMNSRSNRPHTIAKHAHRQQVPLCDVLSRAGGELVHLAWLLDNLQSHIRPLLQNAAAHDPNMLLQLQSFDHIGQLAHALADFFSALAKKTPRRWVVDPTTAAQAVRLADLSSRLGFAGEEKSSCSTSWGEYELF